MSCDLSINIRVNGAVVKNVQVTDDYGIINVDDLKDVTDNLDALHISPDSQHHSSSSRTVPCIHGRLKERCPRCNQRHRSSICQHGKFYKRCIICDGFSMCHHRKLKIRCSECSLQFRGIIYVRPRKEQASLPRL